MSTFVNLGLVSLQKRFEEIDVILSEAVNHVDKNELLYKSLCRSAQVLLSAHLEGYLKDLIKNALEDINRFSTFKSSNSHLKRRFCEHFVVVNKENRHSKEVNDKINQMIDVFDNLETKFKKEHFLYDNNENPKASVLDKTASQFGVDRFFSQLKRSKLDLVFSNTNSDNLKLCGQIKEYLLESTNSYPYKIELSYLEIDNKKSDRDSFWDEFLSDLLRRRHDIAHGKEIDNSASHSKITSDKVKVEILLYALTSFICIKCNPSVLQQD